MADLKTMLGIMQGAGDSVSGALKGFKQQQNQDEELALRKDESKRAGEAHTTNQSRMKNLLAGEEMELADKKTEAGAKNDFIAEYEKSINSTTLTAPEDEKFVKEAKRDLKLMKQASIYGKVDPEKMATYTRTPEQRKEDALKQQLAEMEAARKAQKAEKMGDMKFGAELDKTKAETGATKALGGQRFAELAKTKKETELLGIPKPEDKKAMFEMEQGLRKEYIAGTKSFGDVRSAYEKVGSAAKAKSAMGDHALIFAYMKMIDPGSTVREGEYATVEQARGVPAGIVTMFNKAKDGEKLNDSQRSDIIKQTEAFYHTHEKAYESAKGEYGRIAREQGLDEKRVTPDVYGVEKKQPNDRDYIRQKMGGQQKQFTPSWGQK